MKPKYTNYRKHWKPDEKEQFIEDWTDDTIAIGTIIKRYKRPYSCLVKEAYKLGIGQRHEHTEYLTVAIISEEMQIPKQTIINSWMRNHGLKYKQSKTSHKNYLISQEELLRFLEEHQELFDASKLSEYLFYEEPQWLIDKRKKDVQWYPSKNKSDWTLYEDNKLIHMFKKGATDEEIGKELHRGENFIKYRRQQLKLTRDRWNAYELEILREYSPYKTISELAKMLPLRTEKGIALKAMKSGIEYHWSSDMCKTNKGE